MSDFDIDRIPDHVIHDAVYETLGGQKLEKIPEGYRFRCPICGDSKKNKLRKRGYITNTRGYWLYTCHNECGKMSFLNFLKSFHLTTYKKVLFHGFAKKKKNSDEPEKTELEKTYKADAIYTFKPGELVSIFDSHPTAQKALKFCKDRQIRKGAYSKFFVCIRDDKFFDRDANGKFIYNDKGYPKGNEYGDRLIIPYYTFGGKWVQFDARALEKNAFLRYRNLEGADREMYNIDWVDTSKPFFFLEGSINSTFLRNSVAFGGTKHLKTFLEKHPQLMENIENGIFIWDNDEAGYDEMIYTINLGFKWFNWSTIKPSEKYTLTEDGEKRLINDINDLVLYTDLVERDNEGFITFDSIKKYIEEARGGIIKTTLLYGNRKTKRKERFDNLFKKIKRKETVNLSCQWGQ